MKRSQSMKYLVWGVLLTIVCSAAYSDDSVDELIQRLQHPSPAIRANASRALSERRGPGAVDALITALKHEHWLVRSGAAEALGKIGDARAVESLIVALKDEDNQVRRYVAEALDVLDWQPSDIAQKLMYFIAKEQWDECVKTGDTQVIGLLIAALGDQNCAVQRGAAGALGKIGKPAVEPLIVILKDEDDSVRGGAAEALGKIGDPRAVEPLVAALSDENRFVRSDVAQALDDLGWKPADTTQNVLYLIAKEQWGECARIGGGRAIDPLIALLHDRDWSVRAGAIESLGKAGEPAVEPLVAALRDRDSGVRTNAAVALGAIGDARAVDPLIAALKDEKDDKARSSAAEALVKIGEAAVEPLVAVLKNGNWAARSSAAQALGVIGDVRAVGPLIAALTDVEIEVRWWAVQALGKTNDKSAVPGLVAALPDCILSEAAANALQEIGWEPQSADDKVHYLVAKRDRLALAEMWPDAKRVLLKDVESNEYAVIENALQAFVSMGREEVIPELINVLAQKGTSAMAVVFLNCRNKQLRDAAREWANKNGYHIGSDDGGLPK